MSIPDNTTQSVRVEENSLAIQGRIRPPGHAAFPVAVFRALSPSGETWALESACPLGILARLHTSFVTGRLLQFSVFSLVT